MDTLTKSRPSRRWLAAVALIVLAPGAIVIACSSNNANPQPGTVYQVDDAGGTQPPQGEDSGPGYVQPDDSGFGNPDAPLTQLDGALVSDASVCTTDADCWSCTPQTPPEFLNQCTASQCTPFVNAQRLPNYDGGLPPLH